MAQYLSFMPLRLERIGVVSFGARLAGLVHRLLAWRERARSRRLLAGLDDHVLRDIGIDRATVEREAGKPFWQA